MYLVHINNIVQMFIDDLKTYKVVPDPIIDFFVSLLCKKISVSSALNNSIKHFHW